MIARSCEFEIFHQISKGKHIKNTQRANMKKRNWKKLFPETVIQHLRIDRFRLSFISKNKRLKLTGCKKENSKLMISFELIAVRIDSQIGSIRIDS